MTIPFAFLLDLWDVFLLIFIRMTGLFVISPVFGRQNIPGYYKVGFSFLLAVVVSYNIPVPDLGAYNSLIAFIFLVIKEFLVGLVLGYISYLIITALYLAGQMIDMHIGFGMVSVFDPMSNIQIPVTANLYFILTMLIFVSIDGHYLLIYAISDSFTLLPIGSRLLAGQPMIDFVVHVFASVFSIGFKIAAPVTAAIIVTDVALGVISKAVPQVNVFIIGLPLKILIGLLIILFTLSAFRNIVHVLMGGMQEEMVRFLEIIRGDI